MLSDIRLRHPFNDCAVFIIVARGEMKILDRVEKDIQLATRHTTSYYIHEVVLALRKHLLIPTHSNYFGHSDFIVRLILDSIGNLSIYSALLCRNSMR